MSDYDDYNEFSHEEDSVFSSVEVKEAYKNIFVHIIEEAFTQSQSSSILDGARTAGFIESCLVLGGILHIFNEEEIDNYSSRVTAITDLKIQNVIPLDPFLFIPDNTKGKNFLIKLYQKMADVNQSLTDTPSDK